MDTVVEFPCPICMVKGKLLMRAHTSEIPYFGEHTQVTLLCDGCGWRQTDFIPAEGSKAGGWTIQVDNEDILSARVVRSSSCTICIPELDLEVNPGSSNAGYVTNIEGMIVRFKDVVEMVLKDIDHEEKEMIEKCNYLLTRVAAPLNGNFEEAYSIELLDPRGHSQILHGDALPRDLSDSEIERLPVGPDPAVFSQ